MSAGPTSDGTIDESTIGEGTIHSGPSASVGEALITSRLFWAGYGVLMAVMGTRLPVWSWPPPADQIILLAVCVPVFALLAQPYVGRPVLAAVRLENLVLAHRNTLLTGGFVMLVACDEPPAWAAGVDALLLAGYLVLTDAVTVPPGVLRRTASPAFLLTLAAVIAGATALVALPAASGAYRPLLAAAAGAAALGAALATAFGSGEARRVGSAGEPNAVPRKVRDRSSE